MTVLVGLSLPDPKALAGLVSAQYAPGTPLFHAFRTSAELRSEFGPPASQVTAALEYFEERGLSVSVSTDGLLLSVTGPSDQIGAAFHTAFQEYRGANGRLFISHPTPATLPAVAPWSGAYGLGNVTPITPTLGDPLPLDPKAGFACSGTVAPLIPCQIWQAYNMTSLIEAGTNGSGFRLAVVDPYASAEGQRALTSDLWAFSNATGVPVGSVNFLYPIPYSGNLNSSLNPGWNGEDALDLEWARASAPGATIEMTFSPNSGVGLYQAVDWVVAHQAANVISLSWGEPDVGIWNSWETPCSTGCNASTDGSYAILTPVLEYAAAEGIGVFAASGDCGAYDGTSGFSTNFPASDPTVTGVGGTALTVDGSGNYISEVGWSGDPNGGVSPGCANQGGSGGGYSPFPRPPWQVGVLPSGTSPRGVPDVSLDAAISVFIYLGGTPVAVLGTSVSTPIWAGIAAIADDSAGQALGDLNPSLYSIAAVPSSYSRDFHDVTQGNNGYSAGPGWDPVTGLGSPRVASLVVDLTHASTASSGNLTTFVYGTPRFGRAPFTTTFHVNATGGTRIYPLEGVSFGDGNASVARNNATSHTYERPGVYLAESYVMDSHANSSVSPPIVIVVGGGGPLTVNLTASTKTPALGGAVDFTASVSGGIPPYLYNFTFGDGTYQFGTPQSATSHVYNVGGSFCASVVVSDSAATVDGGASQRAAIGVGGAPLADCANDTTPLVVHAGSAPAPRDAPADFPDLLSSFSVSGGSTAAGTLAPSFALSANEAYVTACDCSIFRAPGVYTVTAYANDSENEQATATESVTVAPPLLANFSASTTFGDAPLTVTFRATAQGGLDASAANTTWDFGDTSTGVGSVVTTTYSSPGKYDVIAHLSDRGYGNASEAFVITVLNSSTGQSPALVLSTTISPVVDVPLGDTLNLSGRIFYSNGSNVPQATPEWAIGNHSGAYRSAFNWTFSNLSALDSGALIASFTEVPYDSLASFENVLTLPDFAAVEPGGFLPRVSALNVLDSGGPVSLEAPADWNGTAAVSGPGSLAVAWSFGNGTVATNLSVHQVLPPGVHTVDFEASDSWGDRATDAFPVVVAYPLELKGGVSPLEGTAPLTVQFNVSASGGVGPIYEYDWAFGDNTTSNETGGSWMNGTHTFESPGSYHISLTIHDAFRRSVTESWNVSAQKPSSGGGLGVPWTTVVLIAGAGAGVAAGVWVVLVVRRRRVEGGFSP